MKEQKYPQSAEINEYDILILSGWMKSRRG